VGVKRPRLWSPASPYLYRVTLTASVGGRSVAHYGLHSGIRSIKVVGGHLYLNGAPANFRGVGLQEDSVARGFAIGNATRNRFIAEIKELGATVIRAHYPLHPELLEQADRQGLLVWSEIPVYGIKTQYLKRSSVRRLATEELRDNILANSNHPSIMLWSIGNELSSRPGPVQGYYITKAAALAHGLDPGRPVGIAVAAYPSAGCQTEYGPLDVIGINEYFGWYPGPGGQLADREALSPYLDTIRACYPNKAIVISEFGAEANRDGPVEEKGTYAFQEDFVNYHLGVFATKPWLSGVIYWALEEFRVRPGWDGGDPHPDPPWHEKGLISRTGQRKPAFADVQRAYRSTQQWGAAPARRR
jgi:beta-glucuronidase